MAMFDAVCPMDGRYVGAETETQQEVEPFLSINAETRYLLRVECALLEVYSDMGLLPVKDTGFLLELEASIPTDEVYAEEEITQHNIRALVNCIQRRVPDAVKPFVHLGPTSADITDTGRALQLGDFTKHVLLPRLIVLEKQLLSLAEENADTPQVGRTHGQHAVPTTFGHAVALYVSRLGGRIRALEQTAANLVGKLNGAVGAYNSFYLIHPDAPKEIESRVMARLGLKTSPTGIASQIVEPEPVTDLACAVVSGFSVLANLADDLRHLMRTELREIKKETSAGHVGSSTMPHKVNPKDFENVKSLWKAFMPRIVTVFLDQISEHQRDLTNSASGRFLNELLAGYYYGVVRMSRALKKIRVNKEAMMQNLERSRETYIAEPLYIVSGLKGIPNSYDIIKKLSETARNRNSTLSDVVKGDGWPDSLAKGLGGESLGRLEKLIESPETYRGLACEVTRETCSYWREQISRIERKLPHKAAPGPQPKRGAALS